MIRLSIRTGAIVLVAFAGLATSGCARLKGHQGYVVDADLVNSVQPGVDTRDSVAQVLGKPSFAGQFGGGDWYYVSRDTRNFAYNSPRAKGQTVLRIQFNAKNVVSAVDRTGIEQVAAIKPYDKTTPTLGRHRSFFEDLFGNIGTVGSGLGPTGGGGGNREEP